MNAQIFFSTFVLIFVAELGDKTQLAAMARAASSESAKWTIFAAASSALVLSTLVAVLLGSALTRVVPEKVIRIAAAVLFIVVGGFLLHSALAERPTPVSAVETQPSLLSGLVLRRAAEFEQAAFENYRELAGQARSPVLRDLLSQLAAEEETHFEQITAARDKKQAQVDGPVENGAHAGAQAVIPEAPATATGSAGEAARSDRDILDRALAHERATADFYAELARLSPVPSLKRTFLALSQSEQTHVERLVRLAEDTDVSS